MTVQNLGIHILLMGLLMLASVPDAHGQAAAPAAEEMQPYTVALEGTAAAFDMIPVPGGIVEVGGAAVEVAPFWVSKTELPWEVYDAYVYSGPENYWEETEADAASRPSKPYMLPGESFGHNGLPALGMTWKAVEGFAAWLSEQTGDAYAAITEAQWQRLCEASGAPDDLDAVAWYWENAEDRTHPIASKAPDGLGAYDVLGNVREWALGHDGTPVVTGGSWKDDPEDLACDRRWTQTPSWNATDPQLPKSTWWLSDGDFVGMRVVRTAAPAE